MWAPVLGTKPSAVFLYSAPVETAGVEGVLRQRQGAVASRHETVVV